MTTTTDYKAPPAKPHVPLVAAIESDQGRIVLAQNLQRAGYRLAQDVRGFGAATVENELTPRLGRRGAMLGPQRETEGEMRLPIVISSTSSEEVRRLVSELTNVLKLADGTAVLSLTNPDTGHGRYRRIAYKSGLDTPGWSSPNVVQYVIVVDYMDPWAYSTHPESVTIPVAPGASGGLEFPLEFPVEFAESGATANRWGTNNGTKPAPVTLRFDGPARNPEATLQGLWTFRIGGTLAHDEYLVIDPTDLSEPTATVHSKTNPGQQRTAHSMISTSSRFTDLIMPPGQHTFSFTAIDDTYTASMTASWPHAYAALH